MRIATWNINGLRARMEYMALWLEARQPDIVGLQELKTPTDDFPHEFFAELGYTAYVHGQKSWNGVAVLSKAPMEVQQLGLPGEDDWGSRLITTRTEVLEFTTVYCPNGKKVSHDDYPNKLRWYETLVAHYADSDHPRRVLCGDFNIVPTAIDTWMGADGEGDIFHTVDERNRLQGVMDMGLVDLWREQHGDEQAFSWWDYRGGAFHRKQGLRIDFILATPEVAQITEAVTIDRDFRKKQDGLTASDHAPVYADLKV
ncbi:MAG: exodeoxyribonuclease III [Pseudomonadota bacterium]